MKALILLPTYNERDNLPVIVDQVLAVPHTSAMVIDDGSPDGTGRVADELAAANHGRVSVLHRTGRRGLGRSYRDGMKMALTMDVDVVCQMDADLSHDPKYLPELFAAAAEAEVVIGSRYLQGVSVVNWPLRRLMLSTFANAYVRTITGMAVRDCTAGFRCWRRDALARMPLDQFVSDGYSFQVEMLFHALECGWRVTEVPIIFVERRQGASKMSKRVMFESMLTPWRLVLSRGRLRREHRAASEYNRRGSLQ
jgi:dolichol-phosphate mannosyltransferase